MLDWLRAAPLGGDGAGVNLEHVVSRRLIANSDTYGCHGAHHACISVLLIQALPDFSPIMLIIPN